jgi:DNA-binding LytR/AlgR family response regulator
LLRDILYAEAQGHYIALHTASETISTKMNLSEIEESLGAGFFRCQRSFIVNIRHIKKITRTAVVLSGGAEVPLSRDKYDAANRAVIDFYE